MDIQKYYHTKVLDSEVLEEAIRLRTTLHKDFVGCKVELNHDGTAPQNNVELSFSKVLTSAEWDSVAVILNEIGPSYDLQIRKGIENGTMTWAMAEGMKLMAQLSANNVYRGKTAEQIERILVKTEPIIRSLVTGSLKTTYAQFSAMAPDGDISQEEIDEFKKRLEIILGL